MRAARVAAVLALAALTGAAAPTALAATPPITRHLNLQADGRCPLYGDVRICSGEVPSWDGTKLDVDITLPVRNSSNAFARLPLMIMLHGFGQDKHTWQSTTDTVGGDLYRWNSHWFARRGYYVLTHTARGFPSRDATAGKPATPTGTSESAPNGTIRLKSREFEIRDTQWLAALAAKSLAIDPRRVAVTGGSYGGGESWLQASQARWSFPDSLERLLDPRSSLPVPELQVAVPKYGWTDLLYSLTPNGHAGGGEPYASIYDSSQGSATSDSGDGNPFGVPKQSYIGGLYAIGAGVGTYETGDSTTRSEEGPISIPEWKRRTDAGDPFDVDGVEDATVRQIRRGMTEFRSAYYQDEGWQAQRGGRKVAIFGIQGWTDDLFPAIEAFRQFRYLKRLDPDWPVALALADVGHLRAQGKGAAWARLNDRANAFLADHIDGSREQATTVYSEPTVCGSGDSLAADRFSAASPTGLSAGSLSIAYARGATLTSSSGAGDPDAAVANPLSGRGCRPSQAPTFTGRYTAVSEPLTDARTFVGLGHVTVPYALSGGTTATLNARVWDVPPSGDTVLVTRGTYRFSVPRYNLSTGFVRIPLFGNHFKLAAGHKVRLDLAQVDEPTFQGSNAATSVRFDPPTLVLPTRESGGRTLTGG